MFLNWNVTDENAAGTGELVYEVDADGENEPSSPEAGSDPDTVSEPQQNGSDISSALMTSTQAVDFLCETIAQHVPLSSQVYLLADFSSTPLTGSTTQSVFTLSTTMTTTTSTTTTPSAVAVHACSSSFSLSPISASQLVTSMNHYSLVATTSMAAVPSTTAAAPPTSTVSPLLAATAEPDAAVTTGHKGQATIIGAIVGSILGAASFFCLLFFLFCLRRRRHRLAKANHHFAEPPIIVRQDASPIPDTASHSPTLGHMTQLEPQLQPHLQPQPQQKAHRPHSTSSWPSRLSSAILTPIRESIRPVSPSFTGSSTAPNSADHSTDNFRNNNNKATRLFSGVFLVPPAVSESTFSPSKEAHGSNKEHDAEQPPDSSTLNWPLRNSMGLRSSYIDRVRLAEYQEHQRNMFVAHQETLDKTNEASRRSLVYPPPTVLAPERVGRGASDYRPSFVAGPEYVVDEAILAASPTDSRHASRF